MAAWCAVVVAGALLPGCSWAQKMRPAAASKPSPTLRQAHNPVLAVQEPFGTPRRHWPVTAGVPFPAGAVRALSALQLTDGGTAVPLQTHLLSCWPDGSARWVLLDWQADLKAREERHYQVRIGVPPVPTAGVKIDDLADRVEIDTGALQFAIPKHRFALLTDIRVNGETIVGGPITSFLNIGGKRVVAQAPSSVRVIERGPLRARIEMRGRYSPAFEYVARLDAFANQPFVRVLQSFEQHSTAAYTLVRQIAMEIPLSLHGKISYTAGREGGPPLSGELTPKGWSLFQENNELLHVAGARRHEHAAGWVDVHDRTRGVAVAARFFWQEYPQSFELRPQGLTYNMWAPQAAPAKVGMGAAKTHEVLLYFHGKTAPARTQMAALAEPVLARIDPQWIVNSGALPNSVARNAGTATFLAHVGKAYRRYQAHAARERWDDSGQVRCPDRAHERPRQGFYGMFNWGDWNFPGYHDTTKGCDAWGNLEYDMTQVLALAYAATGERAYFEGMTAAARHFMDVDHIYFQAERPMWVGMNHPKNPLHFSFELGGVDLGHTWTEGLLSYYYLTGDERSLQAAEGIADYLARRSKTAPLRGNPRQWGWPQIALVAAYKATGNEAYKTAARVYARGGMTAYPPDRVTQWKMGILAEGLSYTHAVTQDPAIHDWLLRYAKAVSARGPKVDARFFPAVAYVDHMTGQSSHARLIGAMLSRLKFGSWGKPFTLAGRIGFRILSLQMHAMRATDSTVPRTGARRSRVRAGETAVPR